MPSECRFRLYEYSLCNISQILLFFNSLQCSDCNDILFSITKNSVKGGRECVGEIGGSGGEGRWSIGGGGGGGGGRGGRGGGRGRGRGG